MNAGRVSSAALMLSGVAAVVNPRGVADALHLAAGDGRGVTETRAGLGGTYAALGGWALVSREPAADVAVGMTWRGAAVTQPRWESGVAGTWSWPTIWRWVPR